jgi:predicted Zn-dependent peptidase
VTIEDPAEKGFTTDQEDLDQRIDGDEPEAQGLTPDSLSPEPLPDASAGVIAQIAPDAEAQPHAPDLSILDVRPGPGRPRDYHFPRFERYELSNGLTVVNAHVAGRALVAAQLLMPGGGWTETADQSGVTVLTARAMTEGTRSRDANDFVESAERLGAEIHADATWEALTASVEVPRRRFGDALALLAEMVSEPAFPDAEVERLRDERLNDLLQAWSDPRRRSERVFPETIYDRDSPYRRPLAGIQSSVRGLDRDAVAERHRAIFDPSAATLVVAGDLGEVSVAEVVEQRLGSLSGTASDAGGPGDDAASGPSERRIVLVDRPGAPQSEVRIGHVGISRLTEDFHSLSVLNAILGGTFNSRLNRVIREELGYTYGIHSAFDMRRRAGPFVIRTAVETAVTVPALLETLRIVSAFREGVVEPDELTVARDYLVGVFPLRFEGAAQVASALGGLVVFELPDDELDRYRPSIAATSAEDVQRAALDHIRPDELSIVIVGDAKEIESALRAAELGDVTVIAQDATAE